MIDIQSVQRWRKQFIVASLLALLAWTSIVTAVPARAKTPNDLPGRAAGSPALPGKTS